MSDDGDTGPEGEPLTVEDTGSGIGAVIVTLGAIVAFLLFGNRDQ